MVDFGAPVSLLPLLPHKRSESHGGCLIRHRSTGASLGAGQLDSEPAVATGRRGRG